jgi:hypothetical protein
LCDFALDLLDLEGGVVLAGADLHFPEIRQRFLHSDCLIPFLDVRQLTLPQSLAVSCMLFLHHLFLRLQRLDLLLEHFFFMLQLSLLIYQRLNPLLILRGTFQLFLL